MGIIQDLKDKIFGTEKQNKEASERMKKEDEKDPSTVQAKVNKAVGYKKGGEVKKAPTKKSEPKKSSASKRADGCATKGKTRGKIV